MNEIKMMQRWSDRVNGWIIGPNTSHLRCDIKMPRREFNNLKKIKKEKDIFKILNSKATLHKHPIYTLESSKHPLNLVRLSL
jgi:hypothetical protein